MRSFQPELFSSRSIGSSCQTGNMAALLNSLFFVFKHLFLPKYRVIYYDYIVKWCSGISCNWCVSLDIASMLALRLVQNVYCGQRANMIANGGKAEEYKVAGTQTRMCHLTKIIKPLHRTGIIVEIKR